MRRSVTARPATCLRLLPFVLCLLGGVPGASAGKAGEPGVPDKALQKAIDDAIEKGAKWIRAQQNANGSMGGLAIVGGTVLQYEAGVSSLCGLALLAAGDKPGDASVDKLYAYLKEKDAARAKDGARMTYDSGTLLMFLTEYHRSAAGKKGKGKSKEKDADNPCRLPDEARTWMNALVSHLVGSRKPGVGWWGYPMHRDDLSNTQYALLGLRAARDCGATVPSKVFEEALKTTLERQEKNGPKVPRKIANAPGDKPYTVEAGDRARGWGYLPGDAPAKTGSMTTAAIAILAICNDALLRPERSALYPEQTERDVKRSVQDGFAWLDKFFAVDKNPGSAAGPWHYYYLYGLERASVFAERDLIGEHDWYIEGAKVVVGQQQEDGRWSTGQMGGETYLSSDACDTAWAILFLKRATRPMPPIHAPVVTEGD